MTLEISRLLRARISFIESNKNLMTMRFFALILFLVASTQLQAQFYKNIFLEGGYNYSATFNKGSLSGLDFQEFSIHRVIYDDKVGLLANYTYGIGYSVSKYFDLLVTMGSHNVGRRIDGVIDYGGIFPWITNYSMDKLNNKFLGGYTRLNLPVKKIKYSLKIGFEQHTLGLSDIGYISLFLDSEKVNSFQYCLSAYYKLKQKIEVGVTIFYKDFYNKNQSLTPLKITSIDQRFLPVSSGIELSIRIKPF